MFASYALSIARRSRGFIAGSAPPRRAATVTSLMSRVKILPFFASAAVSLPFFLAAAAWVGRDATRSRLTPRDLWAIVFLGFIGYYLASFVDFLGLQYVSAGLGRLILFLYPTLVVLLSIVFLHKRPSIR